MSLTHADVKTILEIVDRAEHLDEIELVFEGLKLHVRRSAGESAMRSAPSPVRQAPASSASPVKPAAAESSSVPSLQLAPGEIAVKAPMIGTFYRASAPGEKPFVEVGQRVKADDTIGIIEVMKLFNTIRAEVAGTVVRIEGQNGALVEFDQPLVIIAKD